jgi:hypothetical protein
MIKKIIDGERTFMLPERIKKRNIEQSTFSELAEKTRNQAVESC